VKLNVQARNENDWAIQGSNSISYVFNAGSRAEPMTTPYTLSGTNPPTVDADSPFSMDTTHIVNPDGVRLTYQFV
jgi:hypothetical protein